MPPRNLCTVTIVLVSILVSGGAVWAAATTQPASQPASEPSTQPTGNAQAGPLIFFEPEIHVGKVAEGETPTAKFYFENDSRHEVSIKKIRTSCSCTIAENYEKPIAPREDTTISIRLNTAGRKGPFSSKIIVVYEAAGKQYEAILKISADIHQEGKLASDQETIRLGSVIIGSAIDKAVTISNIAKTRHTRITKVEAAKWLKVSYAKKPDSAEYTLTIKGAVPNKLGRLREKIIVHTDNKIFPTCVISLRGWVEGIVIAVPEVAYALVTTKGGDRTATLRIIDRYKREIESVELVSAKRFFKYIPPTSCVFEDTARPFEKILKATLPDGLPTRSTLDLNARVRVVVEGKEYRIPISMRFVRK